MPIVVKPVTVKVSLTPKKLSLEVESKTPKVV